MRTTVMIILLSMCCATFANMKTSTALHDCHRLAITCPPQFVIKPVPKALPSNDFKVFGKYMRVFGVSIYATAAVPNIILLHAANVLAQYIDFDERGVPNNFSIVKQLIAHHATLVMFSTPDSPKAKQFFNGNLPDNYKLLDLYAQEVVLKNGRHGRFDASLEEILHLVTDNGYANTYPHIFGTHANTKIALAMDKARGGHFTKIPTHYPKGAWYTYHDKTCDYSCQITEYTYWIITSHLGGQDFPGRGKEINNEWKLYTPQLVKNDKKGYAIITNPIYALPDKLPDGHYK